MELTITVQRVHGMAREYIENGMSEIKLHANISLVSGESFHEVIEQVALEAYERGEIDALNHVAKFTKTEAIDPLNVPTIYDVRLFNQVEQRYDK